MAATLDEARQGARLARLDGDRLDRLIAVGEPPLPRLYDADAEVVIARVCARFSATSRMPRERHRHDPEGRAAKKTLDDRPPRARERVPQAMRYRSIRDLASGETGAVVAALRPIWLMSPTSVSDTLPLDPDLFDVVIYDEASQIPVEEAVPAMHRARPGDRRRRPDAAPADALLRAPRPTTPRPTRRPEVGVVLDGDSFLARRAGRLPSTMLTWHYRSRYEALIQFSNAAFYEGRLATIPDRRRARTRRERSAGGRAPMAAPTGRRVVAGVDAARSRPISLHRWSGGVYSSATNPGEATYIAGLVRELLARGTGLTIGIVAFSEAQQTEIERALERLADVDADFAAGTRRSSSARTTTRSSGCS